MSRQHHRADESPRQAVIRRAAALFAWLLVPGLAAAQNNQGNARCEFVNTSKTRYTRVRQASGEFNTFLGGGVYVVCKSRQLTLRADSLESYGDEGRLFLVGRVHYDEPRLNLTSDFLTYKQFTEQIFASSNVVAKSPKSGSTLRGPAVEYFRVMPDRPATKLIAVQRPTVDLIQKDSSGKTDTLVVIGDRITMIGDSLVYASGKVTMTRPEVVAAGDSAFIDSEHELMVLMKGPSITGRKDKPYTLTGVRIEMTSKNRKLDRIFAMGQGMAVSQDMTLASDTIDLRVANDLMQRAIAWGPGRAHANSATQQIVADSIDIHMPGQRLEELHAVRGATAEGRPDSLNKYVPDTTGGLSAADWLSGDTIVAHFDTMARRDTANAVQLKTLIAHGGARSYYHLAPRDTTLRTAASNYVRGRQITLDFLQRRISTITVREKATGIYSEPKPEIKPPTKADSASKTSPATKTPVTKAPPTRAPATKAPATKTQPPPVKPTR
jgi:hypothetical protein